MTIAVIAPKVTKEVPSRKLVMEPCPQCRVNTAFQFSADTSYYIYCLNCGYIKNLHSQAGTLTDDGNK